jgi:hypothetical protein
MGSNVLFFAWNRALPQRERLSSEHFQDFVQYLGGLQGKGAIQSFDIVFLDPHGGDLNGFFLIQAEPSQLDALVSSEEWGTHVTRALMHLEGLGMVRGRTGDAAMARMNLWRSLIPD